jgi:hypothetical protein
MTAEDLAALRTAYDRWLSFPADMDAAHEFDMPPELRQRVMDALPSLLSAAETLETLNRMRVQLSVACEDNDSDDKEPDCPCAYCMCERVLAVLGPAREDA